MDSLSKVLRAFLLWQFVSLAASQYMPQMYQGPMGPPMGSMGPMMGPMGAPQMQMAPMPPMQMGPMPIGLTQPKLPVVVMPYHSKSADKQNSIKSRRRRRKRRRRDSDSSGSSSSSEDNTRRSYRRSGNSDRRRHQVLTPVISYVTKDGYVVYQKKIRQDRAKDWLNLGKNNEDGDNKNLIEDNNSSGERVSSEETVRQVKRKFKNSQNKHRRNN